MSQESFVVLMPVKPPAFGKSRLAGLGDDVRRRLAEAFAGDTVAACIAADAVAEVLVATDDAAFSTSLGALGAHTIPDGVAGDLNGTLRQAAAEARRRWPKLTPVAVCADLPALRSPDLDDLLNSVSTSEPCFVADAHGIGTTVYVASHARFDPRFGPSSRAAHLDTGAIELATAARSVRRDVDDLDDLRDAIELGVGRRTADAVSRVPPELLDPDATTGRHPDR
jgi:2-phospho-L-lactate guanylyltransferase